MDPYQQATRLIFRRVGKNELSSKDKITRKEPTMTSGTNPRETLLERYDLYVWEEKQCKEKLRKVLEKLMRCKNEDEMELIIEEKIEGLEKEIEFLQSKQIETKILQRKFYATLGMDIREKKRKKMTYSKRNTLFS